MGGVAERRAARRSGRGSRSGPAGALAFLRLPVATLAALAVLASGCAQRVEFREPAGTTVLVEGQRLGTIPFSAGLARRRALAVELRPPAQMPDGLEGPGAGAGGESIRGVLVLPRSAPAAVFRLSAGQLRQALASGATASATDTGPEGLTLYFKGSSAGVRADDPEVAAMVPTRSWFTEATENLGEGIVLCGQVVLIVGVVALALWGASRTCCGQEAVSDK